MKILFMGTPDFAVASLDALIQSRHEVAAVFSQPDKPVGRKHILTAPPVKQRAVENNIEVYQPDSVKTDAAFDTLTDINPDVCVVVAYGKLLPKRWLDYPKYGCVNLHASLLPKYRGASPIQWSIVCGERETGVTTMLLDEGMDTGDILLSRRMEISAADTAETLSARLAKDGAQLLLETLDGLENGTVTRTKQDDSAASYAPILKKEDALIDWSKTASQIDCLIRGLHSWPVAYTTLGGKRLKIYDAQPVDGVNGECGHIISCDKKLLVACAGGTALQIESLQAEGSRAMSAAEFLRGNRLENVVLGEQL